MKKRLLCLILCLAMLLSLSGCGRRNQRSEAESSSEEPRAVTLNLPPKKQRLFLPPKNQTTSQKKKEESSSDSPDATTAQTPTPENTSTTSQTSANLEKLLSNENKSYQKELRAYEKAMSKLNGKSFVLKADTEIDLVAFQQGRKERAKETVALSANIKHNNTKKMEMSGSCKVTAPNNSLAYQYYCKGDNAYVEYTSPRSVITQTTDIPSSALMNYQLQISKDKIRYAEEPKNGVALLLDGSVLNLKALLKDLVKSYDSVDCDGVELQLYTDKKGRPSVLYLYYSMSFTIGNVTAAADYEQTLTFSGYGKAKVKKPGELTKKKNQKQKEKDSGTEPKIDLDEEMSVVSDDESDVSTADNVEEKNQASEETDDSKDNIEPAEDNNDVNESTGEGSSEDASEDKSIETEDNHQDSTDENSNTENNDHAAAESSYYDDNSGDRSGDEGEGMTEDTPVTDEMISPIAAAYRSKLDEFNAESDQYTLLDVTGNGVNDLIICASDEDGSCYWFYSYGDNTLVEIGSFSGTASKLYRDENGALIVYWLQENFGRIDRISYDGAAIVRETISENVSDGEYPEDDENSMATWENENAAILYERLELWTVSDLEPLNHVDEVQTLPSVKTDLADYILSMEEFHQVIGGELSAQFGDYQSWYIRENLEYGNYYGSTQVDAIELETSEYQLFGISIEEDVNQACWKLEQDGWTGTSRDETVCVFEQNDRVLALYTENGTISSISFGDDTQDDE